MKRASFGGCFVSRHVYERAPLPILDGLGESRTLEAKAN